MALPESPSAGAGAGGTVLGSRERRLPAPPAVVRRSLAEPHQPGARPWLHLLDDEVAPVVVDDGDPDRLAWRSLWPRRPDLLLTFRLRPVSAETALRWTLTAAGEPPEESLTGHLRYRVNHLLWADLRLSYGQ
jgi:hypothetical protein